MPSGNFFSYLYKQIILGLAGAFVILVVIFAFYPDFFRTGDSHVAAPTNSRPLPQVTTSPYGAGPVSYADAVASAAPAIVNIYSSKVVTETIPMFDDPLFQRFFGNLVVPRKHLERSLGSGVIITPDGYLLSNYHVVENAAEILVALTDGRTSTATIIGNDPDTDLTVLKIELDDLPSATLGNSENLRVGDIAMAIGNPFGVGQTVTLGIISATGRTDLGINTFENFIQTDAAINPGNSGGGLINARGELIGINTAIFSKSGGSQGIGFAIPISIARMVLAQIIEQGFVTRGWLGMDSQDLTPQLLETFQQQNLSGVVITQIYRNSPAHIAGLRPGDVLMKINGETIIDSRHAMNLTTTLLPDETAELTILRGNKIYTIEAKVMQRPQLRK
jgi:serine protease DegS